MKLFVVVALLSPLLEYGRTQGEIGTIVELLDAQTVLVEFAGTDGVARAEVPVPVVQLRPIS